VKQKFSRRCLNIVSDSADAMCGGRLFQKLETGKACLPTLEKFPDETSVIWHMVIAC